MKKIRKIAIAGFVLILVLFAIYFFFIRFNFHTVISGQVYRCAQPSAKQLAKIKERYKIRSVINLRSLHFTDSRYQAEARACHALKIYLFHLRMSPKDFPSVVKLKELVNLLRTVPKPMLIHCRAGADRTGLASAITLILHDYPIQAVTYQYSYHDLALSPNSVGKLVIPYYICWLKQHNLKSSRKNFLIWLHQLKPGVNFPLPGDSPNDYRISSDNCKLQFTSKFNVTKEKFR
ncbi:MAG: tyrosine-protein phosphatase [Gammaproteobacteria bacterium]|jgi:undecaprenyl-diphosphatase